MFTANDINLILSVLEPRPDLDSDEDSSDTFLPSSDGTEVISADRVKAQLHDELYERASVAVRDLAHILDLQDAGPIADWADRQPDLSTAKNQRISLQPWVQKTIAIYCFKQAKVSFLTTAELSHFWGVKEDVIQDIIQVYGRSFYQLDTIAETYLCSPRHRQAEVRRLQILAEQATRTAQTLDVAARSGTVPLTVTRALLHQYLDLASGDFQLRSEGAKLLLIPEAAVRARSAARVAQLKAVHHQELHDNGLTIVRSSSDTERREIVSRLIESSSTSGVQAVQTLLRDPGMPSAHWPREAAVLITAERLAKAQADLHDALPMVARTIYTRTANEAATLRTVPDAMSLLLVNRSPEDVETLVLFSNARAALDNAFAQEVQRLAQQATAALRSTILNALILPTQLYAAGAAFAADDVLREKLEAFVLDFVKNDLLKAADAKARSPNNALGLPLPRTTVAEWERAMAAVAAAPTLAAAKTAMDRLRRKLKPLRASSPGTAGDTRSPGTDDSRDDDSGDDDEMLLPRLRDAILEGKLAALHRARRGSDLLQQATWILLACAVVSQRPALFISSGKDASRMVKLYGKIAADRAAADAGPGAGEGSGGGGQGFDWIAAAEWLERFRAKVKEGSPLSEEEMVQVRVLTRRAFESRRT